MIVFTNRIIQCIILEEETRREKDKDKQSILRAERNAIRVNMSNEECAIYWSFPIKGIEIVSKQVSSTAFSLPIKMPDFSKCVFVS